MPKIAELRRIDGAIWCRLADVDLFGSGNDFGTISIYTEKEIAKIERDVALEIIGQINTLYPKEWPET